MAQSSAQQIRDSALRRGVKYGINQIPSISGGGPTLPVSPSGINDVMLPSGVPLDTPVPTPIAPTAAPLGSTILPLAAVAYGTKALKDSLYDKKELSLAQKLAMALPTVGLSLIPGIGEKIGGLFGDKDRWKTEGNRLSSLSDQGYNVSNSSGMGLKRGRSKSELAAEEQAKIDAGGYGNLKFASSRNEGDLTGQDIQGYASVLEKAGKDASIADRIALGQKALDAKAVNEHNGTIDVDWSKVNLGGENGPTISTGTSTPVVPKPLVVPNGPDGKTSSLIAGGPDSSFHYVFQGADDASRDLLSKLALSKARPGNYSSKGLKVG